MYSIKHEAFDAIVITPELGDSQFKVSHCYSGNAMKWRVLRIDEDGFFRPFPSHSKSSPNVPFACDHDTAEAAVDAVVGYIQGTHEELASVIAARNG